MGEMIIRRNRGIPLPQYQVKAEKTAGSAPGRAVSSARSLPASETLQQLMNQVSQAESRTRDSRRTLQAGEGVLAEVQDALSRISELAQEAGSGDADRAALQAELEGLRENIDRMLAGALAGGTPLFLDGEAASLEDGAEALLYAVLGGLSDKQQEIAETLPDWLVQGLTQESLSRERLLAALGLDKTAGGGELLAAVMDTPLEHPAVSRLAALYLGSVIAGGTSDPELALAGLGLLLERVAQGTPPDQAIEELTGGLFTSFDDFQAQFTGGTAPGMQAFLEALLLSGGDSAPDISALLPLLAGLEGMRLDLIMGLLAALPSPGEGGTAEGAAPGQDGAAGAEGAAASETPAPSAHTAVVQLGNVQVIGRDLSGVTLDPSTGVLTLGGTADVTVQGLGEGEQALLITGSGAVTLQEAHISALTVAAPGARLLSAGTSALGTLLLRAGAALTLGGGGQLKIGLLQAELTHTLRVTGGAVTVERSEDEGGRPLALPAILEGPASLAAPLQSVHSPDGRALAPFDLVWKTLLPGWGGLTAAALDGQGGKLSLWGGTAPDHARFWMDRGDPSHGYPIHTLVLRGRDPSGQLRTRYAYLRWSQSRQAFQELSMYPNPFTVTGGEPGLDWVYEEESHTLHILTGQVTAVSGGTGTDANQAPFSGRIALADGIGALALTLGDVVCRVASGPAFCLGRDNDVSLLLDQGSRSHFESGAGCAGISLGEGTSLRIDRAGPADPGSRVPTGALTAAGHGGGAGIGRDSGGARDRTSRILICGGIITASGSGGGAGIGAGKHAAMGPVSILGGTITSTGGTGGGAGIGGALGAPVGDIRIRGGWVTAVATHHAAAIGAGIQGECGDIHIEGTARIVKAVGGDPGADIGACLFGGCGEVRISGGADIGGAKLWTHAGVPLQMGERTVTLPQFRLSSRALRLDGMSVLSRECAQAAQRTADADRRWVAQIQGAYSTLHSRLERSFSGLYSVRQYISATDILVRDTNTASTLLEETRRSLLLQPGQTMRTHSRRGTEDVRQLLG